MSGINIQSNKVWIQKWHLFTHLCDLKSVYEFKTTRKEDCPGVMVWCATVTVLTTAIPLWTIVIVLWIILYTMA
jgi:hypothetical protein